MTAGPHCARRSKHAVIAAHPEPASFTLSVAHAYIEAIEALGGEAVLRDLYRLGFDPVLKAEERLPEGQFTPAPDVAAELAMIEGADVFVLVYPLWFGTPPAILKGYIERVMGAGFSQPGQYASRPVHPLLGGRQLLSFSSSGATERWMSEHGVAKGLQSTLDGYLARAFWMDTPRHIHFGQVSADLDKSAANQHLARVRTEAELISRRVQAAQTLA